MPVHDNRRLFDLVLRNAQRQGLAALRRDAAPQVRRLWEERTLAFHPETPAVIPQAFSAARRMHDGEVRPPGQVLVTSSPARASHWLLDRFSRLRAKTYLASLGIAHVEHFGDAAVWFPHLPVTRVSPEELIAVFNAVPGELPFQELAVVAEPGTAFIVCDSYGGYLDDEPSAEEIVYELSACDEWQ